VGLPKEVTKNTLVDYPRLYKLERFIKRTEKLEGEIAEVGVYKGGTAYLICSLTQKHVYLFDTFEGMPEVDATKDTHHKGDFADTSYESVFKLLYGVGHKTLIQGIFPSATGHWIKDKTFSLVHLDCDIYPSVKESLEFFYPRMTQGGIIVLDDYAEPGCPGAKLATDEFLADKPEVLNLTCQSQAMFVKV